MSVPDTVVARTLRDRALEALAQRRRVEEDERARSIARERELRLDRVRKLVGEVLVLGKGEVERATVYWRENDPLLQLDGWAFRTRLDYASIVVLECLPFAIALERRGAENWCVIDTLAGFGELLEVMGQLEVMHEGAAR